MGTPRRQGGLDAQFLFQRGNKGVEEIEKQAVAGVDDGSYFGIDERAEHQRPDAVLGRGLADALARRFRLLRVVDKAQVFLADFERFELGEEGVAQGLCRDGGAV